MNFFEQSDPTRNPNFSAFWSSRPDFFRDDSGWQDRLADADRRRADGLAAERSSRAARLAAPTVKATNGGVE